MEVPLELEDAMCMHTSVADKSEPLLWLSPPMKCQQKN